MVTDIVNQIIVDGIIPVEWERGDAFERGTFRWLKLKDQILNWGSLHHFYLVTATGEKFSKDKNLYFTFVHLEKTFDWVPRDVACWTFWKLVMGEWLFNIV